LRALDATSLLERIEQAKWPATIWLDGPDESLKAAWLAEFRHVWAAGCPEAPAARVFRAAESGVEEILAAFHGGSLFTPRELILVLEIEDLGRSEKKITALAEGLVRPSGGSTVVLVESSADTARKALEPLRVACEARLTANPLGRMALLEWGRRRLARAGSTADTGVLELIVDASEGDAGAFFNEIDKLMSWAEPGRAITLTDAQFLLRPVPGADLVGYLSAVALGDPRLSAQRLGRLLAAGASEGTVLFALVNLVGGALGGWARHRDLSAALRRRRSPRELAHALDALYRAEAAWKRGRADVVAVLEQATREVAGTEVVASPT
jgi:DNA polymerase III delta subunit